MVRKVGIGHTYSVVEPLIGTAYDMVVSVADNLDSIVTLQETIDQFNAVYLGPHATEPTTDNAGNPLIEGAQYYNTTDGYSAIYISGVWVPTNVSVLPVKATEQKILADGQLVVSFTAATENSSFFINGPLVDSGQLFSPTHFSSNDVTKVVTLVESYPAGTTLTMVYSE